MKWIYTIGAAVCLLIAAHFYQMAQVMDLNARLIAETRELRIQVNTHDARIKALAAEQSWVREKVKIGVWE